MKTSTAAQSAAQRHPLSVLSTAERSRAATQAKEADGAGAAKAPGEEPKASDALMSAEEKSEASSPPTPPAKSGKGPQENTEQPVNQLTLTEAQSLSFSKRINRLVETRQALDELTVFERDHLGFMTKWALINVMPYAELPPGTMAWTRRRRRASVTYQSGLYFDEKAGSEVPIGIPFGIYPRLIMLWIITTAFRLKTRKLTFDVKDFGIFPLKDFLEENGRPITYGAKGNFIRIKDQVRRLFSLNLSVTDNPDQSYWETGGMRLVDQASMYSVEEAGSKQFWSVEFTLSESFYKTIVEGPIVPLDLGIGVGLGKSAQALDIYMWLCLQCFIVNKNPRAELLIDWRDLEDTFGSDANTHKFRESFKRNLNSVITLWPGLAKHAVVNSKGLVLYKGVLLTVPPKVFKQDKAG